MKINVKIAFYLRFYTRPGQSLYVSGNIGALGLDDPQKALALQYMNAEFWNGEIEIEEPFDIPIRYHYILRNEDGMTTMEWGDDRVIEFGPAGIEEIQVMDTWNHAGEFE